MRNYLCLGRTLVAVLGLASWTHGDEPPKPTPSATESNPAVPAPGHSLHGEAFNEGPRRNAYLMAGQGKAAFPVTTTKAQAQQFINQGVAQLHSFYFFEAERSFRQAARFDPDCAMAYWGMALANVNNPKRAQNFLREAEKRAAKISPREKMHIEAFAELISNDVVNRASRQWYQFKLETIVKEFPDNLDARAWLALVLWNNSGPDAIAARHEAETLLESIERIEPMHPGVHHYRIHLWDGVKPNRARKSAALYAEAAPGIAHAWHMPGHTYTDLLRFSDAAYHQEGAARVDHAYMLRDRVMPFEIFNYVHNNQWLVTSLSRIGRVHDAIAVARNLVEQPRDPRKNGVNDGGSAQRSGRLRWSDVLVRYELWDDLIEATTSGALDWSDIPVERKQRAYTLGLAYAAKGDRVKLALEIAVLQAMSAEANKLSPRPSDTGNPTRPEGYQDNTSQDAVAEAEGSQKRLEAEITLPAALAELEGHQKLQSGEIGPAFERFAKAESMRPEAQAHVHLKAHYYAFAESTAKQAADWNQNQVVPLAAYVEILQGVGKIKEAQEAYRKLEPLAREAGKDMPVFQRLAPIVASWKASGNWAIPASSEPATADATTGRIDLSTLGPLTWSPFPAEPFALKDTAGQTWSSAEHRGRNVLVLFYLGGKCAHCMQQLQLFSEQVEPLKKLNTDVVAVSTDTLELTRELKSNADGIRFVMPLLSDPQLNVFKKYRSFDDFENQPLHGTFLIDAQGGVRYQRISADPFLDVEFILAEVQRVNTIVARERAKVAATNAQ